LLGWIEICMLYAYDVKLKFLTDFVYSSSESKSYVLCTEHSFFMLWVNFGSHFLTRAVWRTNGVVFVWRFFSVWLRMPFQFRLDGLWLRIHHINVTWNCMDYKNAKIRLDDFFFTGTASPTEIQILGVEFVLCEIDAGTERVPKQMGKFKSGKSLGMRVAFLSSVFVTLQIILWSTHPRLPVLTLFLVLGTCRPFMTRLITPLKDGKNSCKSINISF